MLGLQPEVGREFDLAAEIPGNGHQVILSDRVWRTHFGADRGIVGSKITLNREPFTVIGVMPAGTVHPGNWGEFGPSARRKTPAIISSKGCQRRSP